MSNGSPTAYLLWAILASIFIAFLLGHLWAYDRYNCLKWDSGRQPGAFKRVMTYSYLATLPLLVVFSVAMTALKFKAGYILTPSGQIIPRPLTLWDKRDKHWLLPLYFVLSTGWSLELVTHLEELSFWLFLLHQGPAKREWFHSWEFRTWYLGSMVAVLGMPLVTLVTRRQIETVQGWIFLAGASAGLATTVSFLYVLARFPGFIQYVKDGGAEPDVVVRLATFYSLNRIRVVFRFLFTVPLLMIGIDALSGPYPIIGNPFALDFLLMMGGIGCFISSAITLLIFFPRSITRESGYKAKIIPPQIAPKGPAGAGASPPLPSYYTPEHERERGHDVMTHPSPKTSLDAPRPGARAHPFRYASIDASTAAAQGSGGYPTDTRRPRRSADSETSPGYESDAESIAMGSPTVPFHLPPPGSPLHQQHVVTPTTAGAGSGTAASRPSMTSGGRSDDTVWERQDDFVGHEHGHGQGEGQHQLQLRRYEQQAQYEYGQEPNYASGLAVAGAGAQKRRPHSDGPFVYNRHGIIVAAIPGSVPPSEEGHGSSTTGLRTSERTHERESTAPSLLHPYLINFTSPIDLLDDTPEHLRPPHIA